MQNLKSVILTPAGEKNTGKGIRIGAYIAMPSWRYFWLGFAVLSPPGRTGLHCWQHCRGMTVGTLFRRGKG